MAPKKITTVLFDLDGTLLDTAPDLANALNQLLEHHKKPPLTIDDVRQVTSEGTPGLLKLAFNIEPNDEHYISLRESFIDIYCNNIAANTAPFNGIENVLNFLDEQDIGWGVVTNKNEKLARQVLGELNLLDRARCVIGADTTPRRKPHPLPLTTACDIINCTPAETVFVGDSIVDIEAAKRADMRNVAALYGYIPADCKPETWEADYYIDQPEDLVTWLTNKI